MPVPSDDAALLELAATRLGSAVLSDALDQVGRREQAMAARLRPIWPQAALVGRAHTVLTVDVYEPKADPYRLEIEAVDSLKAGDVLLASTGPSTRTCFWGELLSTAARGRGARGAVIDGYVRDVRRIEAMAFPVFAAGMSPVDSAGRSMVVEYGGPIACGGVVVQEGDLVVGDSDGLVVVPRAVEAEVIRRALEKVEGENRTRAALEQGLTLTEVYAKYGVL
ncbi:MAG TPA: RraA family protein [Chloroflexota bacterium]|nr:RraA family protein [Chloroflexota bacterium]